MNEITVLPMVAKVGMVAMMLCALWGLYCALVQSKIIKRGHQIFALVLGLAGLTCILIGLFLIVTSVL